MTNKKKIHLLVILSLILCQLPFCQLQAQKKLSGRVIDGTTRLPLAGVLVSAADLQGFSVLTEEDGSYVITVPDDCPALSFSAPDFNTEQQGTGKSDKQPDIKLYPSTLKAYDNSRTSALVSSYTPAVSVGEEIQKQLGAQVHTTNRSGIPGIGDVMFIGGLNSLNANAQPLIVVDGVIFDQQRERQMLHSGYYNDVLANISPADIERVTVLRNGTALYGAKGSNGVILIETRRNKSMATRITVNISAGVTMEPKFVGMMGAEQYRSYASELLKTTNTTVSDFKFLNEDPDYYYYKQYHNETDWKDKVYRTAFTQNYGINVEGGDEVANYNLSLGYTNAQSTLAYNSMNRLNIRFNTDIKFSNKFHTRFDASFSNLSRNLRDDGTPATYNNGPVSSPSFLAYVKSPFLSPYSYVSGKLSGHFDVNDETYLDEALSRYTNYNYKLGNPYAFNEYGDAENKNRFQNSMLNIAVTPRLVLHPNLSLSEHISYTLVNTNEKYYVPLFGMPDYYVEQLAATRENEVRSLYSKQNSLMSNSYMDWHHRYGSHDLKALLGVRLNWESYSYDTQLSYNTGNDKTPFTQNGPDSKTDGASYDWLNIAWYGQLQYNLLQRYYVQLNLTAETSSRFGTDTDSGLKAFGACWGIFPGVQLGWVVTSEPWFAHVRGINYLRLHAGFDVTGNDDISLLGSRTWFESNQYLDNVPALALGNIGNSKIQWERTRKFNVGLDGNFLDNRLNVRLNMFTSKTDNLLTLQRLSYLTGLDANWSNGGSMTNKGFDATVNGRIIVTRNWQWELGASIGHYKNKLVSLPGSAGYINTQLYGGTVRSSVGEAANLFYGYKTQGVFATSEQAEAASLYTLSDNGVDKNYFKAGDMQFADLDGNKRIDDNDCMVIGNPNPDFFGNISTSLHWKRWKLQAQMNYSVGNDIYNYQRSQLEGGQRFINQTVAMTRRWHGEGHETDIPRITFQDPMGNARFSDRWIEDGSYLKIKTVTLSYRLPVNSEFLQGMEFWIQGNNLFTFTNYLGSDPETAISGNVIGQGIDTGLLPHSRSFVAGVKIKL